MLRVTVGVTRGSTLPAQWPWVSSIGKIWHQFTGIDDVSVWMNNSRVGQKTSNKQTYNASMVRYRSLQTISNKKNLIFHRQ